MKFFEEIFFGQIFFWGVKLFWVKFFFCENLWGKKFLGEIFCVKTFWVKFFFDPRPTKGRGRGEGGEVGDGGEGGEGGELTSYLSFFLHGQNFWRIKFTPKNANFSR